MTIIFYNDINFGEGFLQSLCKNDDLGFRNDEVKEKKPMSLLLGFRLLYLVQDSQISGLWGLLLSRKYLSQDKISDFEMKLMDIDNEYLGILEVYHVMSLLRCHPLSLLMFDCFVVGCFVVYVEVVILITKEGVKFSTKGDIGTTNIVCKQNTSMDKPEEASIIEMNEPLSNIVIISLSNELSVVVEYKIVKMGYVCFYLAPKIEEGEEDTKPQV
ncbi:hypothetical protein JHK87_035595 [Glycine soja]|nr:hypothetical protein JHK87_035595 [Glycine soja]